MESLENSILPLIQYEGADQGVEFPARLLLWILGQFSRLYGAVVQLRLCLFKIGALRRFHLGCQVISVGNVTAGGTGKTPMVEMLARTLAAQGRKVAILSRGYRRSERAGDGGARGAADAAAPLVVSDGRRRVLLSSEVSGDEPYMLATNLCDAGVVVLVDKDRVKSGRYAIRRFGCDILLLDDGFQYQRLRHRMDIVLVDRTNPFGNGRVLPRGILREPARNIARARFICITKARGGDTSDLRRRIRELNPSAGLIECNHDPTELMGAFNRAERHALGELKGMKIVAVSGIAAPLSFEKSLENLGATILSRRHFADHHRYSQQEVLDIVNEAAELGADAVVTTEKDAVRMVRADHCDVPVWFLRIEMRFLGGEDEFRRCINEITFRE